MSSDSRLRFRLLALGLLLFLGGLVVAPLAGLSAEKIHWGLFEGIYEPDLEIVSEDKGAPGSSFFLVGEGYPPYTLATIYVDGQPKCTIETNAGGTADFIMQTYANDPLGRYDVTLATDPNISDTDDIRLEDDEPIINPPPGWSGLFCDVFGPTLTPTPTAGPPTATPTAGAPTATPTAGPPTLTPTSGPPPATATATTTATPPPPGFIPRLYLPVMLNN